MDTWVDQLHRRAQIVIDQIMAVRRASEETGTPLDGLVEQYREMLERLYAEELPSAKLRDSSDLIVRAEGPGADHDAPSLSSFSWLSEHVRIQLRRLSVAMLPLAVKDAKAAAKKLQWAFTGYAPGSIMMGFALRQPESMGGFEQSDKEAFQLISASAQAIATVPQFVGDLEIDRSINEVIQDPALRDSALMAAWQMSPTSQSGIHTIEVASKKGDYGTLSQRERMILRTAINSPEMIKKASGSFVGYLRAADLDNGRAVLRDVLGLDAAIRCILFPQLEGKAKALFGGRVKVTGDYETDRDGRPRLMHVFDIEPYQPQGEF